MQLHLPFLTGAEAVPPAGRAPLVPPVAPPAPVTVFVRSASARRYILRVRPDGTLRVTIPRRGSRREADAFVARQRRWIERERSRVLAAYGPREWRDGSEVLVNGALVRLTITGAGAAATVAYGERSVKPRPGESIRRAVERDLNRLARTMLEPRLRELAASHAVSPGRVTIRNQRSRWGSCAANGNIALNFRLVQMPPAVRDYVLVHELMHLREQNHSRRFWRLVEAACPEFRAAERWLRQDGKALF